MSMLGKARFLFLVQMLLVFFMGRETVYLEEMIEMFKKPPVSLELVLTRFMCAIFLHISLSNELKQSFMLMKYA